MSANIVTGMDLDKLEAFRSALKQNPVILGLEARGVWEGHSGRSTIHIGPFVLGGEKSTAKPGITPYHMERGEKLRMLSGSLDRRTESNQLKWH